MIGIVEGVAAGEGVGVETMFQKLVIEELVRGSSLICRDKGERGEDWMYTIHTLVRRFILSDMERGSALWNEMYGVALVTVHEVVKAEKGREVVRRIAR